MRMLQMVIPIEDILVHMISVITSLDIILNHGHILTIEQVKWNGLNPIQFISTIENNNHALVAQLVAASPF